jgi:hypothetical protein
MRHRLRALERALACQRAQVIAEPIVEQFIEEWAAALETGGNLPDPIALAQEIQSRRVPVLTFTPLTSYLAQCQRDHRIPDPQRLTHAIIHGYLEMHLKPTCACGYHP